MKQLSGLDATFLYLETAEMPMHVGALHLFELPAGFRGKFTTALRQHVAQRLPLMPALRRRLWWMPLNLANPAWVDAEPDLKQHIVEVKLPKAPGGGAPGLAELEAAVGALHPVLLDRQRPLWKFHVFEGLAPAANGRKRVALYTQLHHAAVDGQAAVALANVLLDTSASGREVAIRPSGRQRHYKLGMTEMLRGVLGNQAQKVAHLIRELPSTARTLGGAAGSVARQTSLLGGVMGGAQSVGNLTLAPRTPLNTSVSAGRAFAAVSVPLPELKRLGKAFHATLNDMVLMLCSSALRRFYGKRRQLPRKSLVAAVPVSLRAAGDRTADNQASMSFISLGTHLADPAKRLAYIVKASGAMKDSLSSLKSVMPTDFPSLGVPWLMEAATALYGKARVADRIPQVANLVISNVPGPPVPLFMAGAQMLSNYPTSIVVHGLGLNITVQSYDQHLDFGLMADAAALPEVRELAEALLIALDDVRAMPRPGDAAHEPVSEPEHTAPAAEGLVGRARQAVSKRVNTAVSQAVGGAVGGLVGAAVQGTVRGALRGALAAAGVGVPAAAPAGGVTKATKPAKQGAVPRAKPPAKGRAGR